MYILIFPKEQEEAVKKILTDHQLLEHTNNETPAESELMRYDVRYDVEDDVVEQLKGVKNSFVLSGKGGGTMQTGGEIHPDQSGKDLPTSAMADQGNPSTSTTSAPGTIPATQQVTTTADTGETAVTNAGTPASTGATTPTSGDSGDTGA